MVPFRQVEVIARAMTEQLQEERKDELAAIRAEICSDVKVLHVGIHCYFRYYMFITGTWSMISRSGAQFLCGGRYSNCTQEHFIQEIAKVGGCAFQP